MKETIISLQNEKVKQAVKLSKSRERQKTGLTLIDGEREIKMALASNWEIQEIFYCPELIKNQDLLSAPASLTPVTEKIFRHLSQKENPDGYLAIAAIKITTLSDLELKTQPLIVVLESVEKPGNLGAIIRTAAAGNIDAVIVADPKTDIYHPNVIRASQGYVFQVPTVSADGKKVIDWIKKSKIKGYAATTQGKKDHTTVNWQTASAIILGTEADGLSDNWLNQADDLIRIPMRPHLDSLNVSVSAAILIYEALRQRNFIDINK